MKNLKDRRSDPARGWEEPSVERAGKTLKETGERVKEEVSETVDRIKESAKSAAEKIPDDKK